jgi:hypothetical protein
MEYWKHKAERILVGDESQLCDGGGGIDRRSVIG